MASNLRKYKFTGSAASNKANSQAQLPPAQPDQLPSIPPKEKMDAETLKADVLASLREDIASIIRSELKSVLSDEFSTVRNELKELKSAFHSDLDCILATVASVEQGLTTWSDEVTVLQTTVTELKKEVAELRERNEDMEGRLRRCNIHILGVAEEPGASCPASVSKLLKEVLHLEKDVLIDRSHRGLTPRKPNGKPRVVIAKLHYYQDCVDVLRRAREHGPLRHRGQPIAIIPDYTAKVAKACAAFNDVRNLLRGKRGVCYGILFPARFRISYNGDTREFRDPEKAMTYVRSTAMADKSTGEQ